MNFQILQLGPVIVKKFEANSITDAVAIFREANTDKGILVGPLGYIIDVDHPEMVEAQLRLAQYHKV